MNHDSYEVLLVEGEAADSRLRDLLGQASLSRLRTTRATTIQQAASFLGATPFDAVLLDLALPDLAGDGLAGLRRIRTTAPDAAVIVLTEEDDDTAALDAMRGGAQDYLCKPELAARWLERSVRYAVERNRSERALELSEERYALAVQGANDGIWDWDLVNNEAYFSPRWKSILGYDEDGVGSEPTEWLGRIHPDDRERFDAELDLHFKGLSPHFESEHRLLHRDGDYRWIACRALAVRDGAGRNVRIAGSLTDITLRRQVQDQLEHDALHDTLTGLANRALLQDRLGVAIARARRRRDHRFAVLFIDLDRFKKINDSLGHLVGDELLQGIARRLLEVVRPGDTVSRLGGDEFAILADDLGDPQLARKIAERVHGVLERPFLVAGHEIVANASIGITLDSGRYQRAEDVLRDADIAMYRAKLKGISRCELFDPAMHASALARMQLETDLERALERGELCLHYQPIVSLSSGALTGFEALVRWQHPQRGLVFPDEFIAVAEDAGLILPLGEWVLESACRQMAAWRREIAGGAELTISVNLSGHQFRLPGLVGMVRDTLEASGLDPRALRLEITESTLMGEVEAAISQLSALRRLGVQIHIDDFGTGYSSLSYLHSLPTDTLKIDRSFVSGLGEKRESSEIVSTIVTLARKLGMQVAAEGLETEDQVEVFRQLACEYGQGFFFSQALAATEAARLVAQSPVWPR